MLWARVGQVTVALGGDIAKEAGVLSDQAALQSMAQPATAAAPAGPPPAPPATTLPSASASGRAAPTGSTCPAGYPIKGNKSRSGELIYHSPGGQF